jgi:predicted N-acetyltransferase YhbS
VLLVGDEPYYAASGFKRVTKGRAMLPGPVDPERILVAELVAGAFEGVEGHVRPDYEAESPA